MASKACAHLRTHLSNREQFALMLNMIPFAPDPLYRPAVDILTRLQQAGHEAYIAGGAVRDHLLGRIQTDLDIATSATPSEVRALFHRTFAVGEAFGVVIVRHRGRNYEVATFREETDYRDGRRPGQVRFSTAQADVRRRDFTINGMLWDVRTEQVLDWVEGRLDVERRLVRTIGDPRERFGEDRLRMVRALRFCSQLDFHLDPATLDAIRQEACHLPVVSWERIRLEVEKMLLAPAAGRGLALLEPSGLGPVLVEALRREARATVRGMEVDFGQGRDWSWCAAVQLARPDSRLSQESATTQALLGFLLDVSGFSPRDWQTLPVARTAPILDGLARALRLTRPQCATHRATAFWLRHVQTLADQRLADQLRLLRRLETDLLLPPLRRHPQWDFLDFPLMDKLIHDHNARWNPPPLLRGERLLELGFPGGRLLGRALEALETEQLEGRLGDATAAEAWLLHSWEAIAREDAGQSGRISREDTKKSEGES